MSALVLVCVLDAAPARAQAYTPCLGCAEHHEIATRWHRPFLTELAGETLIMANHFRLEASARSLGLCESDVLIRTPLAVSGCHAYSAKRAWLIEAPVEFVAFVSPAWGFERRGHPRWASALLLVPVAYHAFSSAATVHTIHTFQRQQFLLR